MVTFQEVPNIQIWGTITTTRKSSTNPKDTETVTMEAPGYEERVGLMLKNIRWSWTGWALLVAIFKLGSHKMIIRPWTNFPKIDPTKGVMPVAKNVNATASPTDFKGATPKGQQALSCGVNPGTPVAGVVGTGSGSDTVVAFSPEMWTVDGSNPLGTGPGISANEILVHEMTHGFRQMAGKLICNATPDQAGYDTSEEFTAILVSNMYRSEMKMAGLRQDHWGFQKLPVDQEDPATFLKVGANKARASQFYSEHREFGGNLKKVSAPFNPIKLL